jgi:hypothetical protein
MSENFENAEIFNPVKTFTVDFDKIKTVEDIIIVLKSMGLAVSFNVFECPPQFIEIMEKGILVEVPKN